MQRTFLQDEQGGYQRSAGDKEPTEIPDIKTTTEKSFPKEK